MHVVCNALVSFVHNNFPTNGVMAEVGCYDGCTTAHYMNHIKNNSGKLHVVDWFKGCLMEPDWQFHGYRPDETELVLDKFKNATNTCSDIITIHEGISWERAVDFEDESLDICFIDACHLYDSVKKDIAAYLPKVKKGGYLMGHDFETWDILGKATEEDLKYQCRPQGHFGVVYAVADFFKKEEIEVISSDNIWIYKKV